MNLKFLYILLLSVSLGFLIGLERNIYFNIEKEREFAGSRTFAIISLLGFLSAYMSQFFPNIFYISFIGIIILSSIAYFLKVFRYHKQGATTHFSALITFLIGGLTYFDKNLAIFITIIIVFLLNIKTTLKKIEKKLSLKDVNAALLLAIMTFIILPLLPNKMIYYFNPYKTWFMAVIIAFLSFLGYLAIKLIGKKYGILLMGAAGGFVSSTALTLSLSKMFKINSQKNLLYTFATGICIANTIMFLRVLIESLLINQKLALIIAFPYILTTFFGIIYSYKLYKKSNENIDFNISKFEKNPLELDEAIKFAIIFGVIYSFVYYFSTKYGSFGIYIISFISGLTDVDATTLSLSSLANNKITLLNAALGISIASMANSFFKLLIVWFFGKKELSIVITKFFIFIMITFSVSSLTIFLFV